MIDELRRSALRSWYSLVWVLSLGACGPRKMTVSDVDTRMNEAVPVGTEQGRVLAILDSLRLEHSEFDEKSSTIAAMVPDTVKNGVVTRSFHITFFFDPAGKLSSHTTKELFTGP
jgi:hypothetical protein